MGEILELSVTVYSVSVINYALPSVITLGGRSKHITGPPLRRLPCAVPCRAVPYKKIILRLREGLRMPRRRSRQMCELGPARQDRMPPAFRFSCIAAFAGPSIDHSHVAIAGQHGRIQPCQAESSTNPPTNIAG